MRALLSLARRGLTTADLGEAAWRAAQAKAKELLEQSKAALAKLKEQADAAKLKASAEAAALKEKALAAMHALGRDGMERSATEAIGPLPSSLRWFIQGFRDAWDRFGRLASLPLPYVQRLRATAAAGVSAATWGAVAGVPGVRLISKLRTAAGRAVWRGGRFGAVELRLLLELLG